MRIPQDTIDRLNETADLVAIIRRHTILKPAGKEFKGCCPFHGEKNPSFFVNPQSNLYYCFGCGAKGNAIRFLVDYERMSFIEAVKELAQKAGIDLPKEDDRSVKYTRKPKAPPSPTTPPPAIEVFAEPEQRANAPTFDNFYNDGHFLSNQGNDNFLGNEPPFYPAEFTPPITQTPEPYPMGEPEFVSNAHFNPELDPNFTPNFNPPYPQTPPVAQAPFAQTFDGTLGQDGDLYQLLQAVANFYKAMLGKFPHAYQYFKKRGLTDETLATFELGYAPDGWQHLEQAFPNDIEGLRILGLVRTSQKGREFNLLRDRVIFPIKDRQGRIVGFAGRALSDEVLPKYINSSDSAVFQKQHILYGLYESRQQRASDWLVVEGYMDVIALYQAGIFGAVAPMGTAINEKQLEYLLKFNDMLTLSFDGDGAGQRAALRALDVAMPVLPDGKSLKFLVLPNQHDPDTFIKENGVDAMQSAISQAMPLSDFLYQIFRQKYDLSRAENKAKVMAEVKEITAKLPKGSSFRWWLNGDMYSRLRDKTAKPTPIITAPTKPISPSEQLLLCLLYNPFLLKNKPLETLYQQARLDTHAPPLPTWQTLKVAGLSELVAVIESLTAFLTPSNDVHAIDANAHLILSALSHQGLQQSLGASWREFIHQHQSHETIELLFTELLCQSIINALKTEQKQANTLLLAKRYKQQLIALETYDRQVIKPAVAKNQ